MCLLSISKLFQYKGISTLVILFDMIISFDKLGSNGDLGLVHYTYILPFSFFFLFFFFFYLLNILR